MEEKIVEDSGRSAKQRIRRIFYLSITLQQLIRVKRAKINQRVNAEALLFLVNTICFLYQFAIILFVSVQTTRKYPGHYRAGALPYQGSALNA